MAVFDQRVIADNFNGVIAVELNGVASSARADLAAN